MSDPFEVLGVSPQASETEIRQRYLELVREYPPDRAPERFAEIRAAYDEARDPLKQLDRRLFSLGTHESVKTIEDEIRKKLRDASLTLDSLLSLAK